MIKISNMSFTFTCPISLNKKHMICILLTLTHYIYIQYKFTTYVGQVC
jgi:hypothetical protein